MRRAASTTAAVLLTLGLAACGSTATKTRNTSNTGDTSQADNTGAGTSGTQTTASNSTSRSTARTSTRTAVTATTTPTKASTPQPQTVTTVTITAPSTSTTASQTAATACVAADLRPAAVSPDSAPGITVLGFTLTNTSKTACESGAYPGIALISGNDTVTDVSTTRTTSDALGATPVTRIDLAPGQEMSFRITLHDSGSGGSCGSYQAVKIIAPNDTATLRVSIPDGPVQSCGPVGVSPVEPGTNGTGQ